MHLTFFPRKKQVDNDIDIIMGKNKIFDKLLVMDDVSGLADKSDDFANFLTVSRKFNFTFVMFLIQCTLQDLTGKWYCHRQKILILFQSLYKHLL